MKVFSTDEGIVEQITIQVWVMSSEKEKPTRYFLKEQAARDAASTHIHCSTCDEIIKKNHYCDKCNSKKQLERYEKMPFKEWDFTTPVYSESADKFFSDPGDIDEFIQEQNENYEKDDPEWEYEDLRLVICEWNHFTTVDSDIWADQLTTENDEIDVPKELQEALDEFNKKIENTKPVTYTPGSFRTTYKFNNN